MTRTVSNDFIQSILDGRQESGPANILIVDDEPNIVEVLRRALAGDSVRIQTAADGKQALAAIAAGDFDLVVTDIIMPGESGVGVMKRAKEKNPQTEVIMITGHASLDSAVMAVRQGAADYLLKPFDDLKIFRDAVKKALARRALIQLVDKYSALLEDSNRKLEVQKDQYDHLADVARVCVGRTLNALEQIAKEADGHLSDDGKLAMTFAQKDNEELRDLLEKFFESETDT